MLRRESATPPTEGENGKEKKTCGTLRGGLGGDIENLIQYIEGKTNNRNAAKIRAAEIVESLGYRWGGAAPGRNVCRNN